MDLQIDNKNIGCIVLRNIKRDRKAKPTLLIGNRNHVATMSLLGF